MRSDIRLQLNEAKKLYNSKEYAKSIDIYENLFNESFEEFKFNDRVSYCWAIYQVHVKNFTDENELIEAVDLITDLIPQSDLNRVNTCPYTFSVFNVLDFLYKEKEYYNMFYWLDKINPNLLDEEKTNFKGRIYRSRKEKFYDYASKAYLECADWELCIEVSDEALYLLKSFTNYGDTWHRWRIAKSLKELNKNEEALTYLKEVLKVKKDWFVYKEITENYYLLNENEKAINYICGAVLTNDPVKLKVNLYYLIYNLLKDSNPEMALKHAELYYLLKVESNSEIAPEIEQLTIDEDNLNKNTLESQIHKYWLDFKFKNKEIHYGTITKYFDDKNFGFIESDYESVFFHKNEFRDDNLYVGEKVSFYTEKSFDKSKNKESVKAVNVRGE